MVVLVLGPFVVVENLDFGIDEVFNTGLWEGAEQDVVECRAKLG